jgi:hypothetical protein
MVAMTAMIAVAPAQAPKLEGGVFAAPARLKAGDGWMGENRYFPSPVFRDMNGDGLADIVIGDLIGRMTVALRLLGDGPARFGPEAPLMGADGEELRFHNW